MSDERCLEDTIPLSFCGERLDKVLAVLFNQYSRARLSSLIEQNKVLIENQPCRSKDKVKGGEYVVVTIAEEPVTELIAQPIPLDILYEDEDVIVVNKQSNLVVHPGAGNPDKTLVNGLLHYCPKLNLLPRAGIIHRLDKDTTGLLIIAKSVISHHKLVKAMQQREIQRHYLALVYGRLIEQNTIETCIQRHPTNRKKMAVSAQGKTAVTHYKVKQIFPQNTLLDIKLETGRTHQIRVHMAHIKHPIIGDTVYGNRLTKAGLHRQALHAYKLSFQQPISKQQLTLTATLPDDYKQLLARLSNEENNPP